jgi:hypothetical protein
MDLSRWVEQVKTAIRMAASNHAAQAEGTGATVPLSIRLWKAPMKRLMLSGLLLSFSVFPARSAQQENPQGTKATRSECYAKVQEWEVWADKNLQNVPSPPLGSGQQVSILEPTPERVAHNIRRIGEEESKSQWLWFFRAMGLGAGLIAAFTISKAIKRTWALIRRTSPTSPAKQQLFVLIVGGTWISVATLLAILNKNLLVHPINLLATVGVYSLPAILFGGICFWWIGKCQPRQKTP